MARHEADREDIMREALALRRRVSLAVPDSDEPVVCGARSNGYWSFYLTPDCVYQLDDELRLRRAYVQGHLYRTQGATLAKMHRERSETETALVRTDLDAVELAAFLDEMMQELQRLLDVLESGKVRVMETIPDDCNVVGELIQVLMRILRQPLKLAPAIKGRP